ncbi:hypothetical protein [Saccharicrinis sp. 156]|uniref:hypothetical protein n=1 Tax=Saccharicrinis sp. 156 TaxID=3417574 RepID=UPI003D353FA7
MNQDLLVSLNYILIAGIVSSVKGFRCVTLDPSLCDLDFIVGKMPYRDRKISFELKRKGKNSIKGKVILPKITHATFCYEGIQVELKKEEKSINVKPAICLRNSITHRNYFKTRHFVASLQITRTMLPKVIGTSYASFQ